MKVGVLWRKYRNVEHQMKITPENIYDDAYGEAYQHYKSIKEFGYDACLIEWDNDPIETYKKIKMENVDIVFNASSEKEVVFLEAFEIPYTGSGLDLVPINKAKRKEIVAYNKLATPNFVIANHAENIPEIDLHYPLFVKPIDGRGSAGITEENIIDRYEELPDIVRKITEKIEQEALIEEFIVGREVTVGVIGYKDPLVLPIVEIEYNSARTNTFEHKMYDKEIIHYPADFSKEEEEHIKDAALNIYKVLNAKDFGRIDMIVANDGTPYFLELNTFAGLTMDHEADENGGTKVHHGYMGYAAKAQGMTSSQLIGGILESTIERYGLVEAKDV